MLNSFSQIGTTNQKSNTPVNSATIASKTRTKRSVIKIRSIYASTLGPAPRSMVNMPVPFMLQLRSHQPTTPPRNHHLRPRANSWHLTLVVTVANNFQMILLQTGMLVLRISLMSTNSANAISRRNFSEPTTSVSTSSTVMPARAGSGPIC